MKILFDEDVPRPLRHDLPGQDISTVGQMGWAGIRNGTLLDMAASAGFRVLLTCDRNMQYQQNVSALSLAILVIAVPNKKWTPYARSRPASWPSWPCWPMSQSKARYPLLAPGAFETRNI